MRRETLGPAWLAEVIGASVLMAAMLGWSVHVALTTPIWSPIDEGAHWWVAHSIAIGHGWPDARLGAQMSHAVAVWPQGIDQEAFQPPLNYLLMAAVDRLATLSGHGLRGTIYAIRLANAALLALLVILLWVFGRLLAPGNPAVALTLPASLFVFSGFVVENATVGNGVLVAVLGTLAVVLATRWRDRLDWKSGAVIGAIAGLASISKYFGVLGLGVAVLIILARCYRTRSNPLPWLMGAVAAWSVVVVPILAWMHSQYGDFGKAMTNTMLAGAGQQHLWHWTPHSVQGALTANVRTALFGDWHLPPDSLRYAEYGTLALLAVASCVVLMRARGEVALARLEVAAVLAGIPAFLVILAILSITSGQQLLAPGRYDVPAAIPLGLLLSGWTVGLPAWTRWPVAVGVVGAAVLLAVAQSTLRLPGVT